MEHATTLGRAIKFIDARPSFSSFDYVEDNFPGCSPILRLFSQARCLGMCSVVSETIDAVGLVADENEEIKRIYADHTMDNLRRLTFWSEQITSAADLSQARSTACIGYALLKQDSTKALPDRRWRWHVFEAVIRPTEFAYSYVPGWKVFNVRCGDEIFEVPGVLYCQQNGLNKACAQVALRSLCSLHVNPAEVSFRRINELAGQSPFDPGQGLEVRQIQAVLKGFKILYTAIDYNTVAPEDRTAFAYQKFVYAGIESGAGALLGFKSVGPNATYHIIPFFGHTLDRDAWVPNAEATYFQIGDETKYIPSESWISTFLGHDDNFGSNYAIPRVYITPDQAQYVVSLYPRPVQYGGVEAEALAVNMLYSVRQKIVPSDLRWHRRALTAIQEQKVVLRPIAISREKYIRHLRDSVDWQQNEESREVCDGLQTSLPDHLWLIELSVPELFSANLRKLGEILLDASIELNPDDESRRFILARLPGSYIVQAGTDNDGTPKFNLGPSKIKSHTALYTNKQPSSET